MPIRRLQPEGRLAGAVVHGTIYLADEVTDDPSPDAEGTARATAAARLVDPRWRVEITAVAALP